AQGGRCTWLRLLHQPGEPQGRGATGPSGSGARLLVARRRAPGPRRRPCRAGDGRGGRRLLRPSPARQPPRRLGLAAEPPRGRPRRPRRPPRRGRSALRRRRDRPAPTVLGRLPRRPGPLRVLAGAAEPPPRPPPLHAGRPRRLDRHPPRTLIAMPALPYGLLGKRVRVHLYTRSGLLLGTVEGRVADVSPGVVVGKDPAGKEIKNDLV